MPYFIAVLALVVFGIGFTLSKQSVPASDVADVSIPTEVSPVSEAAPTLPSGSNSPTPGGATAPTSNQDTSSAPTNPAESPITKPQPKPASPAVTSTYRDGTFSTRTKYRTPGGNYEVVVGLTVKGDTVTASTLSFDSEGAKSGYSDQFASAYQSTIIGKNLDKINLSRVGGASLTSNAFNQALGTIKTQAKS